METDSNENALIETVEAIGGLEIEIWANDFLHALAGHPEVTLDKIRGALKLPMHVVESKRGLRACLFYSMGVKDENIGMIYFCVVVGVRTQGKGKLETAYETTYMKSGKVLFSQKGG